MDANAPRRGESERPRIGGLAVAAAVVALVAIVAIASSGSVPGAGIGGRRPSDGLLDTFFTLFVLVMAVGTVLVVLMLPLFGREVPELAERRRRSSSTRAVLRFLLAMAIVGVLVHFLLRADAVRSRFLTPGANDTAGGTGAEAGSRYEPDFAVWPAIATGVLAVVAVTAWWLVARGRHRVLAPFAEPTPHEALADVLAATLDDLRNEADPRKAVIGAYARMERSLAAVGLPRAKTEAPEEYLQRVLADVDVSPRAASRLTALFTWARFSVHDVRLEMKDEAIETLEQVQQELAAADAQRHALLAGAPA
jgi:hypothetical protein